MIIYYTQGRAFLLFQLQVSCRDSPLRNSQTLPKYVLPYPLRRCKYSEKSVKAKIIQSFFAF